MENLSVIGAFSDHPDWSDESTIELPVNINDDRDFDASGATYHSRVVTVWYNYLILLHGRKTKEQHPNWRESPVSAASVVELMRNSLFPFLTQQSEILVYGKTIRSGNTFYCNPSYGVIGAAKQD